MAARPHIERDWAVSPGEVLAEALEEREWSQSELARRMGRPIKTINEIVNAKSAVTPETALQLELVLGIPASIWTSLEATYRQHLAEQRAFASFADHEHWLKSFPLKDLTQQGLLDSDRAVGRQVAQMLGFFEVGSPEIWEERWAAPAVAFRQSPAFRGSVPARAAWLRWGEILASQVDLLPFDATQARVAAEKVRALTRVAPLQAALDDAQFEFSRAGIALVVVPEFEGTRLSGAARWLGPSAAIVQLSLRHKTDDHLWFSCMHEVGHLLDRPHVDFLDGDGEGLAQDEDAETRANVFARDLLIDPRPFEAFLDGGVFDDASVRAFAKRLGVAPGIVAGRLENEGRVNPGRLRHLKRPVEFG